MLPGQWCWTDGYQLKSGLISSEGGQRGWGTLLHGNQKGAFWSLKVTLMQKNTTTCGKTEIRLMLEIFPGEALNLYLKSSGSHYSFLGHKRKSKGCQAAGLLPSWPRFTMSAPLWKACPRQCTRDAQPSHPSTGCFIFFSLALANAVMFDRSDLSCNEPLGKIGTNAVTSHHKSCCWDMNFATLPWL